MLFIAMCEPPKIVEYKYTFATSGKSTNIWGEDK